MFEANRGQTDHQVKFLSRGASHTLFFTPSEMVLTMVSPDGELGSSESSVAVMRKKLADANPSPELVGLDELPGRLNQFIGNDPAAWCADIPTFAKVKYPDVYPGVDMIYYGRRQQLEYDFVLAPGADPNLISLRFEGADELELDREGNLILQLDGREVIQRAPVIYQEVDGKRQTVEGGYALSGTRNGSAPRMADGDSWTAGMAVGFQVAAYDVSKPLIIDPVLSYSTYLGGSGNDRIPIIAVDAEGQAYVAGNTNSANFPSPAPIPPTYRGGPFDVFVAKLNASGTALVYSTYLGGSGDDTIGSIAVDSAGNAYVLGRTNSNNFPTMSSYQSSPGGFFDVFVTKLAPDGSALVYSTYLGGSASESSSDIKVDADGNAYVTGGSGAMPGSPNNFPIVNALQPVFGGGADAFVAKLNSTGSALVYSTFLGGAGNEFVIGIALDAVGNAYLHGQTTSMNLPTVNPLQPNNRGGMFDLFVAKLSASGTSLLYSTYLGGSGRDIARGIAVDLGGNVCITGFAGSADFPTRNSLQTYGGGPFDAFVAKLNADGTALIYSTFLGGNAQDAGEGLALDGDGNVYVAGFTASANFPIVNPIQATYGGPPGGGMIGGDGWVAKLKSDGSALIYSTYFGGSGEEEIVYLGLDPADNVYISGQTSSADYPTVNPLQAMYGGGPADVFVAKISEPPAGGALLPSVKDADHKVRETRSAGRRSAHRP
ncbi:MAG: SBBP repeat-containing protein [Acidobacteria bacterium]|nr:SBBP repeat-containing protein [Acidobacteriota bacterium]